MPNTFNNLKIHFRIRHLIFYVIFIYLKKIIRALCKLINININYKV